MKTPTKYPGSTEPFKPGTGKGAALACGFGAAACLGAGQAAVSAFKAMGWESSPVEDGQFSPQVTAAFLDRAVQDKLDGVVLVGISVETAKASFDRAIAAGLRIACVVCVSGKAYAGKVYDVSPDWNESGSIAAWETIARSGPKAKVVTFRDPQFAAPILRTDGAAAVFKEHCPTCTFDVVPFSVASEGAQPGPPTWNAYLASHPVGQITDHIGMYDGLALALATSTKDAGRSEIATGGYDGDQANLAAIVSGNPPVAWTVAHPYNYESWAAVDLIGRLKAGLPAPADLDKMPNMLVTAENAPELLKGNPPGVNTYPAPAGDWQGNFKKLWGAA